MHISTFISERQPVIGAKSKQEEGLVSEAFCEALGKVIKAYLVQITVLEAQVKQNQLSLQLLWSNIYPSLLLMQGVEDVITEVESKKAKGV